MLQAPYPDTVISLDTTGYIRDVQMGWGHTLPLTAGKTLQECLPELAGDMEQCAQHTQVTCLTAHYDFERNGRWYESRFCKAEDGCYAIIRDITVDKARQERIEARELAHRKALEQSNEELQHFAYAASHDLREPLMKISAFGQRLKDTCSEPQIWHKNADHYLSVILSASDRMTALIDDILTYSRIGRKDDPWRTVDLNETLEETLEILSEKIDAAKAIIHRDTLPCVQGDPNQLVLLFQNLLSNSLKYRHPERTPVIAVTSTVEGQYYVVQVTDNGVGFDMQYKDKVFQIFERLHSRSQVPGTGVGLALCKRIAERHHGQISVTASIGEGATFTVRLPLEVSDVPST